MRPRSIQVAILAISLASAGRAIAAPVQPKSVTESSVRPTPLWVGLQFIPSPEWVVTRNAADFGIRWQVTPVLYSFGINRKLSPWRYFIAEQTVRHSGSIELLISPEYLTVTSRFERNWLVRGGFRAYFPLLHRGEYLSCSVGGSAFYFQEGIGAAYEVGLYTLFGIFGVQATYAPTPTIRSSPSATFTLNIRYF